jgi:sugar phosphate isomerase/epimerase
MDGTGVSIALGDGMLVLPGADIAHRAADLDVLAELRVPRVNSVSLDPDLARTFDQLAVLAELAAARGMETTTEPAPGTTIGDLTTGLAALKYVGRTDFQLLIDTMHLVRSGFGAAHLAALEPRSIGYAQSVTQRCSRAGRTTCRKPCSTGLFPVRVNFPSSTS